jgi:hypothetical protein
VRYSELYFLEKTAKQLNEEKKAARQEQHKRQAVRVGEGDVPMVGDKEQLEEEERLMEQQQQQAGQGQQQGQGSAAAAAAAADAGTAAAAGGQN